MEKVFGFVQLAVSAAALVWALALLARMVMGDYDLFYIIAMAAMAALTYALVHLTAKELREDD